MEYKPWLIFLLLALAVVAESSSTINKVGTGSCNGAVGDCIGKENEMLMDSHHGRDLAQRRKYISYGALKANSVPCGRRGNSYYNCQKRKRANPYKRSCNVITHCARITD
ncbi:hypothetical protein I3843_10G050000 [Carya illinoinensis]|uniref:Protein RALF-like 19 n=1 Tax=Carya illinoinensis TaxID=32201 RepID=A0A8T1PAV2_CARIL|nr:protein RALF-like 19 [Carya illinoinensis]KAG2683780.1 hypothetical protein I3760_10G049400 [Carya illinoinensis]KAG6638653.1 hypothetical protein CIPAW_10G050000 [Carya illinoinensis]KAG6691116.1 hypothetical protein I3842_10G049400 [Carya illinoinensis]KAG7959007.1 hypothetical protein I3843_10G050000 [Carya illinoinensis]